MSRRSLRVVSWNVNGLRSAASKGFVDWLAADDADILCLQEVRARPEQLPAALRDPPGRAAHWVCAERPGYSGVGLLARCAPDEVTAGIGSPEHDAEGRFQLARFGRLHVANGYFPHGAGTERDNSRIPHKLAFYERAFEVLAPLVAAGLPVLCVGDLNTAHREIDLARPRDNRETSGFRPEEREELDRWLRSGWIDTFRALHPEAVRYSWWSQRAGVRERNVGWRIDYVLATPAAMEHVRAAFVDVHVTGSDHCPVGVTLAPAARADWGVRSRPARSRSRR